MGLGSPPDLLDAISHGVDIFDSIFPTQNARRGSLFTKTGTLKMKSGKYKKDFGPIEKGCTCNTCKNYSRSYVHHMFNVHEMLGLRLAAIHNIHFVQNLMEGARAAIEKGNFENYRKNFKKSYKVQHVSLLR